MCPHVTRHPYGFVTRLSRQMLQIKAGARPSCGAVDRPLPGGCHGRTSRSNTYCQKNSCYNGSNFCKVHYQQQNNAGPFQYKRFTGSGAEVCCKATTKRGKECAFVATSGNNYCHLHADCDNNPSLPPPAAAVKPRPRRRPLLGQTWDDGEGKLVSASVDRPLPGGCHGRTSRSNTASINSVRTKHPDDDFMSGITEAMDI
jgi:hypothetical protein